MTELSIMKNVEDPLRLHLSQKYVKCGKKWQSYGQFTKGRLHDSTKYHVECRSFVRASFEPKICQMWQEMAELWPIFLMEIALLQ